MDNITTKKSESALSLVNDSVRELKAYHLEPENCAIKLNQNENPNDWPKNIKKQAARFFIERPWNRYPNFIPNELKAKLARYVGVAPSNIIVGNGSNEMLLTLLLSFAAKAKRAIINSPTFTVYKLLCDGMGASAVSVSLDDELQYDVKAIKQAAIDNPNAMLIICSPNNPVGNTINENDFTDIMDVHSGICVLDQAYMEFGGFDGIKFLPKYPNLIIARTFSKAMSAAGLRLGYMIGAPELITEINKIKLPYNINFFTEHAASLILDSETIIKDSINYIINERNLLAKYLATRPFDKVYSSAANFILVRLSQKEALFDHLRNDGILVRDVSSYHLLKDCLRISIGTKNENARLRKSIDVFFKF